MRVATAIAVCGVSLVAAATASAAPAARTKLNGNRPMWTASAQRVGAVPGDQQLDVSVYLPWRNAADLASLAAQVSNPDSAHYRQYLTPAQFRARFAPSQSDVDAVSAWLKAQGLQVTGGPTSNHWIDARGTVTEVSHAFATSFGYYNYHGDQYWAPDSEPSAPSSIAGKILALTGLQNGDFATRNAAPPAAFVNAPPCSAYWGQKTATDQPTAFGQAQPDAPCGYTPAQLQGAYGVGSAIASGNDGRGQTVAIVDAYAAGTIAQDVNQYSALHGLPPLNLSQVWASPNLDNKSGSPGNNCGGANGWYGEETLDIEAVHAMAPGASIVYSGAASCLDQPLLAAITKVLDGGLAQIISNSYGNLGEGLSAKEVSAEDSVYQQAAAQGVGLYFSSGDDGDEAVNLGHPEADFPATDPWVTAVGGTSLAVGASNKYLFETGWGTGKSVLDAGAWSPAPPGDFLYGAGGGTSKLFGQPSYQQGVVPTSLSGSGSSAMRVVPDVAALGDPNTGMLIGETQTFANNQTAYGEYRIGGTSLASPLLAGMMALADQAAGFHHGFANPALYGMAGSAAFHDITPSNGKLAVVRNDYNNSLDASAGVSTSLRALDHDSSLATAPGYDNVTGVGTPNGAPFLRGLSKR
jgi:subtilase family serine protease